MSISIARIEALVWILIYGGLLGASLGLALARNGHGFGWGFVAIGAVATVVGIVLIWVRSRMREPAQR